MSERVVRAIVSGPKNPMNTPQEMREYGPDSSTIVARLQQRAADSGLFGTDDPADIEVTIDEVLR